MSSKGKFTKVVVFDIVAVVVMLGFIIAAFYSFTKTNNRRTLEETDDYAQAATIQTAERLNDIVSSAYQNINLLAMLYSEGDSAEVTTQTLKTMTANSVFDYVEFIDKNGIDLTADGQTADLSDRAHFKDGMNGNSGKTVIRNSRITNETLLVFYAPAVFNDEITGVFTGMIRSAVLKDRFYLDYFGIQGEMYLVERNGDVILSVGADDEPVNLITSLENSGQVDEDDITRFKDVLNNQNDINSTTFNFNSQNGAGSGYVTVLDDKDWTLVLTLPSKMTQEMARNANAAGLDLQIKLGVIFVLYIVYLVLRNNIQRRRLVSEKEQMSDIVTATTRLFSRFALVDYEEDSYKYLEDKFGDASVTGKYSELVKRLDNMYINEVGEQETMSKRISREYVCRELTPDKPYLQFEYQIDHNGRRWENVSIICLKRRNGKPVKILYAIQDMTEIKEQEDRIRLALKNASEAAEAANRAKSDFLARMSHDIRTPMNAIMGMTAVATMHMDDPERLTDCLNKITISSRHLLALINDVLDMSKIESGKVTLNEEPFSIADLVDSIVTIMRSQTESKHQKFNVRISEITHEAVIGDTLRLRQVFVNILGNAVKFTPVDGEISFTISELQSNVRGMASYEFVCSDTGIGMDKEFIKKIFDPFSRSEQSAQKKIEGTGLGMSITHNIVRMMDGDIKVESEVGKGSVFTVRLYLKIQETHDETEDIKALANVKVLVADDEETSCITTCETLNAIGMSAEWVTSGTAAVEKTVSSHAANDDFAAVILDWKMPDKDGVQTAREIREKVGDEIPIIILSAYDWSDIENEAREAGVQAFIGKPLFRSRLIYALKSVLFPNGLQVPRPDETAGEDYQGKHILLVEDNDLNREIAVELMSVTGAQIDAAENGSQAVDIVSSKPDGYYDLIFMDIQMPIMDGYEATRRIRGLGFKTHVPIIAMTANAFADDIREAKAAGMDDHMSKPVEMGKILEYMNKYIR